MSTHLGAFTYSDTGRNQKARCDPGRDTSDQAAQWELEGTTLDSINNNTVFK
jgi:hypothetical protein